MQTLFEGIMGMGYIPVIAPIGIDADGGSGTTLTQIRQLELSLLILAWSG